MADPELPDDLDPVEFMRALLRLSPEDARDARAEARKRSETERAQASVDRKQRSDKVRN